MSDQTIKASVQYSEATIKSSPVYESEQTVVETSKGSFLGGMLRSGDEIAGWSVLSKIPVSSGEAELYIAEKQQSTGVIKYYRQNMAPKAEVIQKLKGLNSRNIIRLLDSGEHNNLFYEIMEYASGGGLDSKNADGTLKYLPLTEEKTINLVRSVNQAFRDCHAEGILHRDIKPANIFFRDEAATEIVIGDFGISSLLDLEGEMSKKLTKNDNRTEGYAAPEVYSGVIGAELDYYALGISVWEVLTGQNAFQGRNQNHVQRDTIQGRVIEDLLSKPEAASFSPRIRTLVSGLLTHRHDKRWGAVQVDSWLKGETVEVFTGRGTYGSQPFTLNGRDYQTLAEVAGALEENHELALAALQEDQIEDWLRTFDQGLSKAVKDVRKHLGRSPQDQEKALRQTLILLKNEPFTVNETSLSGLSDLLEILEKSPDALAPELRNPQSRLWDYLGAWWPTLFSGSIPNTIAKERELRRIAHILMVLLKGKEIIPFKGTAFPDFGLRNVEQFSDFPPELEDKTRELLSDPNGLMAIWLEITTSYRYPQEWTIRGIPSFSEVKAYWIAPAGVGREISLIRLKAASANIGKTFSLGKEGSERLEADTLEGIADLIDRFPVRSWSKIEQGEFESFLDDIDEKDLAENIREISHQFKNSKDTSAGVKKAAFCLDPDRPVLIQDTPCRTSLEIGAALEKNREFSQSKIVGVENNEVQMWLEAHGQVAMAKEFRKWNLDSQVPTNKKYNALIWILQLKEHLFDGIRFHDPDQIAALPMDSLKRELANRLSDTNSKFSIWIEQRFPDRLSAVAKWRALGRISEITLTYALETNPGFHFPSYTTETVEQFLKYFVENANDQGFLSSILDQGVTSDEVRFWLVNYANCPLDKMLIRYLEQVNDNTDSSIPFSRVLKYLTKLKIGVIPLELYFREIVSFYDRGLFTGLVSKTDWDEHRNELLKNLKAKPTVQVDDAVCQYLGTEIKNPQVDKDFLSDLFRHFSRQTVSHDYYAEKVKPLLDQAVASGVLPESAKQVQSDFFVTKYEQDIQTQGTSEQLKTLEAIRLLRPDHDLVKSFDLGLAEAEKVIRKKNFRIRMNNNLHRDVLLAGLSTITLGLLFLANLSHLVSWGPIVVPEYMNDIIAALLLTAGIVGLVVVFRRIIKRKAS